MSMTTPGKMTSAGRCTWVRPVSDAHRLLVPTVAHILYDRSGRLRSNVRVGGASARVHTVGQLPWLNSANADTALIEPEQNLAATQLDCGRGHLT